MPVYRFPVFVCFDQKERRDRVELFSYDEALRVGLFLVNIFCLIVKKLANLDHAVSVVMCVTRWI